MTRQETTRSVEIVVVDNRPNEGLTAPVIADFPTVRLIQEYRPGASYARNAGVLQSTGDIIVTIDDDVTPSPHWLEHLVAPFTNPQVMSTTGNILPIELETSAQQLFELYADGGLCRGFRYAEFDRQWLQRPALAPPLWELGATANAAFRATIFRHPKVGLWEEMLGAGVPAGGGEDIYLFYKILHAGFTHVYEPKAYVWHQHRRDYSTFKRQIYSYSQGVVAYHLMTLRYYAEWRALFSIAMLSAYYAKRIVLRLSGTLTYPISLLMLEMMGHALGPLGLWRSHQHVRRYGKTTLPN